MFSFFGWFIIGQGVRQVGVLSPWLFLCYNDLQQMLMSTGYGLTLHGLKCNSIIIADDITITMVTIVGYGVNIQHRFCKYSEKKL